MRRNMTVGGFFGVLLILTLAIGSLGLTAQAQSDTPTPSPTPSITGTPPTPTPLPTITIPAIINPPTSSPAPVSLTIWHNWQGTQVDALTTIVKQFQTAHPEIGITVRAISGDLKAQYQAATQAQHGPELLIAPSAWTNSFADADLIAPVSGRVDNTLQSEAAAVGWQTVTYNDQIYGVPESLECVALYYNAQLATKPPSTMADLLGAAKQVIVPFDFYNTAGIFFGAGGNLIDANGNNLLGVDANSKAVLQKYLTQVQTLYTASLPATPPPPDTAPIPFDQDFRLGQVPYLIDGSWRLADLRRYLHDNLHVAPLPTLDNGKGWSPLVDSQAFFLSANADDAHASAAFTFISFFLNADSQATLAGAGQIPANLKAQISDAAVATFAQQCAAGTAIVPRPELSAYWSVLDSAVYAVTVGKQSPDQAVAALTRQFAVTPTSTP